MTGLFATPTSPDQIVVTVLDPGAVDERAAWQRRHDRSILPATLSLVAGVVGVITWGAIWSIAALLIGALSLLVATIVEVRSGECPGTIRLYLNRSDPVLAAVRLAVGAARTARSAADRLAGEATDDATNEAVTWAHALSIGAWRLAQAAAKAPPAGPGRVAVAALLHQRAEAMSQVALGAETTAWAVETGEAMGELDGLLDAARQAFSRLELDA